MEGQKILIVGHSSVLPEIKKKIPKQKETRILNTKKKMVDKDKGESNK